MSTIMAKSSNKSTEKSRRRCELLKRAGKCVRCGIRSPAVGIDVCQPCREGDSTRKLNYKNAVKNEVFAAYGGYVCACCGLVGPHEFMTIDHINGDGKQHVANGKRLLGIYLYRWLRDNNYPPGFQVLCRNCNWAKGNKKECPCKEYRQQEVSAGLLFIY